MNKAQKGSLVIRLTAAFAILLLLAGIMLAHNQTLCRYITTVEDQMQFSPVSKQTVTAVSGEWQTAEGSLTQTTALSISDGAEAAVRIRLRIPASVAVAKGKEPTLTVNGDVYRSSIVTLSPDTSLYRESGEGQIACFNNGSEELILNIGKASSIDVILTIQDESIDTNEIRLIVEAVPVNGGGL